MPAMKIPMLAYVARADLVPARASASSTRLLWQSVIPSASENIAFLPSMPGGARRRWAGSLASSYIWQSMIGASCWLCVRRQAMSMRRTSSCPLSDTLLVRKRVMIDQLKYISQIEHSRHRSHVNFVVHLVAGLIAYSQEAQRTGAASRSTRSAGCLIGRAYPAPTLHSLSGYG